MQVLHHQAPQKLAKSDRKQLIPNNWHSYHHNQTHEARRNGGVVVISLKK